MKAELAELKKKPRRFIGLGAGVAAAAEATPVALSEQSADTIPTDPAGLARYLRSR
jgi:hypothetical protein